MEALSAQFQSYAVNFLLDRKFLQDGLVLLSRVIDIESSSRDCIVFHPQHPPIHSVMDSCQNLVYLKVWDGSQQSGFDEEGGRLILSRAAKLYAGQTQNFQIRERSRQGYLRDLGDATWNICYVHGLENQYQRDAFEVTHIAYNFVMFGTQQLNKSPFGRYWYNNIDANANVDNITANQYTRYSGWATWRNTCLVGSAPPPTLFSNPNYLELLEREATPLIDFTQFPPSAWGGLARFLDNIGVDQPHFVNHYPRIPCDRMHDWDPIVSTMDKVNADRQLRANLNHHGFSLAVMLGHRPTRLAAEGGSANYLSRVGGKLTATRLPNGRIALLLWIIDPSHLRFTDRTVTSYDQIFKFVPMVVNVLEKAIQLMGVLTSSDNEKNLLSAGLSYGQAQAVIAWYNKSMVGNKLMSLMDDYRKQLINLRDNESVAVSDFQPWFDISSYNPPIINISNLSLHATSKVEIVGTSSGHNVQEVVSEEDIWDDKRFDTKIMRRCRLINSSFDFEDPSTRQNIISSERLRVYGELRQGMLTRNKNNGTFVPSPNETVDRQIERCWEEYYRRRVASSNNEKATTCTCTRCSSIIKKVLQNNKLVLENGCRCQFKQANRKQKLSLGWQFVHGVYPGYFPTNNIFLMLVQDLPGTSMVLNVKHLMALLVQTIRTCPMNPQARTLEDIFGSCFAAMERFSLQPNTKLGRSQSGIVLALKRAFDDIPIGGYPVKVLSRPPLPLEIAAYTKKRALKVDLYAFGECSSWSADRILQAENLNFLGYQDELLQMVRFTSTSSRGQ
ncbi:hypothetical protein INT43_005638 [Umbelopsis isabellina]|uniref:Uncharacterized protein n=1 Tax=Mortierella isabellina TaxID=91625 RepID=A0A8H7PN04_MORIS|nr:hypothetical protein INT43_005638 [Umbelopsis isabellina]